MYAPSKAVTCVFSRVGRHVGRRMRRFEAPMDRSYGRCRATLENTRGAAYDEVGSLFRKQEALNRVRLRSQPPGD